MTKPLKIGAREDGVDNNFNLLRMIAASGVLVSHAYPITYGNGAREPLQGILEGMSLGHACVLVFFAISGFFIARSYDRSRSWREFLQARILRLFPALLVILVVTVTIAGLFLTTAPAAQFWPEAAGYVLQNLTLFKPDYDLPGLFASNPSGPTINGSLWTLFYEVFCYTGILAAGAAGLFARTLALGAVVIIVVAACIMVPYVPALEGTRFVRLGEFGLPFAIGTGFYLWRDVIPLSGFLTLGLFCLLIAFESTPLFLPLLVLSLCYAAFIIGYWPHWPSKVIGRYNRLGDYSYGMYIYAFPLQQIGAAMGLTTPLSNIAFALPTTLACAVLSWHLVEGPALKLKRRRPAGVRVRK